MRPCSQRWPVETVLVWQPMTHKAALTLLCRFDDAGLIESFRAEARGGRVGKVMVQAPWEGRFSNHQVRDGMSIPRVGEVAWLRPDGRRAYFKGAVSQLRYVFSR